MKEKFIPDYIFDSIYDITPEFLKSIGKSLVISDIDNTLVSYDDEEPTDEVKTWLGGLQKAGILVSLASNNKEKRVDLFNKKLGLFAVSKSMKPSRRAVFHTMKQLKFLKDEICVVGDQIFTDVLTAKRAGVTAILVRPIKPKESAFFRVKRFFERFFIKQYYKQ